MTGKEVTLTAIEKRITRLQAVSIFGVSDRQIRHLKVLYERTGFDGLQDQRGGKARRKRIPIEVLERVLGTDGTVGSRVIERMLTTPAALSLHGRIKAEWPSRAEPYKGRLLLSRHRE